MANIGAARIGLTQRIMRTSALAMASCLVWAGAAQAQDKAPDPAADQTQARDNGPADIVVTGSRLGRTTFDTPTPVTTVDSLVLKAVDATNVGASINQFPSMRASTTPVTQGFGSFNVGANIVNLRGLGVTRNLVLVDGRRFAPTTREGSVDLNLIPSNLVQRIDVVTGGASAAYGSDALAGVVNVILDKKFTGLRGQVDYGFSQMGDGEDFHAALAFGTKLGDRGHLIVGGEYDKQEGIGNCFTRSWCTTGAVVTNPGFAGNNGLPNLIRSNDNAGWYMNTGGVISINNNTTAATANIRALGGPGSSGITFGPGGSILPFHSGAVRSGLSQVGGDLYPTYTDANITVPVKRYALFGHADFDVSDRISLFAEGSYGHVRGVLQQTAYFSGSLPIFSDNPYIPTAVRTTAGFPSAPADPTTRPAAAAFSLGRIFDDVGRGLSISTADSYRFTGGLDGKLSGDWHWDAYYQYGRTDRLQTVDNNLIAGDPSQSLNSPATYAAANARFYYALDAVTDPATGQPTCRALLSSNAALRQAAAGCVPINLFGAGSASPAAKNYVLGHLREQIRLQQHVAAANLRGNVGDLGAGPIAFAVGAEYRVDKINVAHDALSNQYAYFQNFGSDYNGTSNVIEGYAELGVPIASWLNVDGAARLTNYDIKGFGSYQRINTENKFTRGTWKATASLTPVSWLRVRATQSHDIRAPNFYELYYASASSFTPVTNRFLNNASNTPVILTGGNPRLKPESGNTTTVGVVLQPGHAFRLSVDYYNIRIKDYISTAPGGNQQIIDRCAAGVTIACSALTFDANKNITQISNSNFNLDRLFTDGLDIEAQYRLGLGHDSSLTARVLATYVSRLQATAFGITVDRAGQTGQSASIAAPDWVLNSYLMYDAPHWNFTLQTRYITAGKYDTTYVAPGDTGYATTTANSINDNRVSPRLYVNLFGTLRPLGRNHGPELFAAITNLFDRAPPPAPETQFYTNPVYFDTIGRYYRFGIRFEY